MAHIKQCLSSFVYQSATASSSVCGDPLVHSQACNPVPYRGLPHLNTFRKWFCLLTEEQAVGIVQDQGPGDDANFDPHL